MNRKRRAIIALLAVVAVLIVMWVLRGYFAQLVVRTSQPIAVMDTDCELTIVFPRSRSYLADRTFDAAEEVLRDAEAHMSTYIAATELSALNAAEAGETVELSPQTMELLRTSKELTTLTGGAFDVTVRPVLQAWKNARGTKRIPTKKQLAEAKRRTGWEHFELLDGAVKKFNNNASIDLGG
ncbi:MAG: FAD:protein FMN transferase, partial [Planctomycetota bacterium]